VRRRLLPDSLAAWALFILIGGLLVAEVSTLAVIMQSRSQGSRMLGFFHLADRVSTIGRAIAAVDPAQRRALATALSSPTLTAAIASEPSAESQVGPDDELAELEDILQARLSDIGIADVHVERRDPAALPPGSPAAGGSGAGPVERVLGEIAEDYSGSGAYIASIELSDGSWLNFTISIARSPRLLSADMIGLGALMIALVLVASIWSVRRLTAPYGLFAGAAERFGRDLASPPLPEEGPREVRTAAHAFNLMQERLRRVIDGRNQLVAAISHDLRTPVTRLKLRAEAIDDAEQRRRILADLDEIETMTSSVLAFASDAARPEARATIDLVSLVESLCDETAGAEFEPAPDLPARIACVAQPVALRRCIGNLIANAVKYAGSARVSIVPGTGSVRIRVEDSGPGIPERDMETVFRPFHRLETSRNRDTGGTGLGLTIARSVARAHGGDVVLSNLPAGGLRAEVVLPLTPAAAAAPVPVPAPAL
jgi:signal transduction histidine kinase